MDQQLLLDPKCPMALWVLGPRLHLRCHSVQQLLRDPMFRWVLSVLGHHLRQQFHLVPQFRKPPWPCGSLVPAGSGSPRGASHAYGTRCSAGSCGSLVATCTGCAGWTRDSLNTLCPRCAAWSGGSARSRSSGWTGCS